MASAWAVQIRHGTLPAAMPGCIQPHDGAVPLLPAASGSQPALLPPPAAPQAVVGQVADHLASLTAGLDLDDDGGKAPATGGEDA